jgi:tetratricopeptide (TPR) repeat protein
MDRGAPGTPGRRISHGVTGQGPVGLGEPSVLAAGSVQGPYQESLAIYRELGDRRGEADAAYNLGFACLLAGDLRAAKDLYKQAAGVFRELDDPVRLAHTIAAMAMAAYQEGDLETTDALTEEARVIFLSAGDLWGIVLTSGQVAALALRQGDYERVRPVAIEALEANEKLGNTLGMAVSIQALAVLAVRSGRPEVGVRLAGAVDRIREEAGGEAPPALVGLEDPREVAQGSVTEDRIAALFEEGRAMSVEDAVAYARREA